jgi:hypothetical protein
MPLRGFLNVKCQRNYYFDTKLEISGNVSLGKRLAVAALIIMRPRSYRTKATAYSSGALPSRPQTQRLSSRIGSSQVYRRNPKSFAEVMNCVEDVAASVSLNMVQNAVK